MNKSQCKIKINKQIFLKVNNKKKKMKNQNKLLNKMKKKIQ